MEASVVIPFYNAEATLERAIDSVLAQEGVSLQILLIDNNSTDLSIDIAQSYANKHKNISLHREPKQGANYARNLGMGLAKKDWIQYLDADDELLPQKIVNQLSIANLETIDVILSPFREHTTDGTIIDYTINSFDDVHLSLLLGKYGITSSILWRKTAIESVNGWNEQLTSHQEMDLLFNLIINNRVLFYYDKSECIVHEQRRSISNSPDFPITGVLLVKRIEKYYNAHNMLTAEREKAIQNQYYNKLLWSYKVNSKKTKHYLGEVEFKLGLIDRPWYHSTLTSILGIEKSFAVLKWFSSVSNLEMKSTFSRS